MQSQYSLEVKQNCISNLTNSAFTELEILSFLNKDPTFNLCYYISENLKFLLANKFTNQNIVDIAHFGGLEIFSRLMLSTGPLISFDYTPNMLVDIVKSCSNLNEVDLLLTYITENNHHFIAQGYLHADIIEYLKRSLGLRINPEPVIDNTDLTPYGRQIFEL